MSDVVIDDSSYFKERERARTYIKEIGEALTLEKTDGKDAAIQYLVSHGWQEQDAREMLFIAKDPAKYAGRI